MDKWKRAALLPAFAAAATVLGWVLAAVPVGADSGVGSRLNPIGGDQAGAVLNEINVVRAASGCGPVAANPQLAVSAARHANDMVANGVQGHTGSDGSSVVQRAAAAGYSSYRKLGEIVLTSTGPGATSAGAVGGWMNSPRHRAIITDCGFTEAGFAVVSNGNRVAVAGDFGRR